MKQLRSLALAALGLALPAVLVAAETKPETKPAAPAQPAPAAEKKEAAVQASPIVVMSTSLGDVQIKLDPEKAPGTVANFLKYVDEKFYDGTIFHRVIDGFMIQGGGFTPDMGQKKTHPPIAIEAQNGLKNKRGTIAMARTGDPNSATSQFFINLVDNGNLDYPKPDGNGYTVFGEVVAGMDVVDKIKAVKTTTKPPYQNVPEEPVLIKSIARAAAK